MPRRAAVLAPLRPVVGARPRPPALARLRSAAHVRPHLVALARPRSAANARPRSPAAAIAAAAILAVFTIAGPLSTPLAAQGPGTTSAPVLELAPAPRAVSLGGAYAAGGADDLFALFYNPAAISGAEPGAAAAYQSYVDDVSSGSLAGAVGLFGGRLGVGVQYLDLGEVVELEPDPAFGGQRGRPTGSTFEGGEVAFSGTYARAFGPLAFGLTGKAIRSELGSDTDLAEAVDIGVQGFAWNGRLALGGAVQNLGPDAGAARTAPLPRRFRAGTALRLPGLLGLPGPASARTRLSLDVAGPSDDLALRGGAEARFDVDGSTVIMARIGYDASVEDDGVLSPIAAGAGILVDGWGVDYAYRGIGALGAAHQFGVRWQRRADP